MSRPKRNADCHPRRKHVALGMCQKCYARQQMRKWRVDNRWKELERIYGITREDYGRILDEQGGGCAVCGATEPGPSQAYFDVDHDHDTGKVRGLLCRKCNLAIGWVEKWYTAAMARYLGHG